jgi:hypothetical protein
LIALAAGVVLIYITRRSAHRGVRFLGKFLAVAGVAAGLGVGAFLIFTNTIEIGPIPKGTPINLLANLNPDADKAELSEAILKTASALKHIKYRQRTGMTEEEALAHFLSTAGPALLAVNKCPDFVEDRGHEFGADLSDADKESLIAFLKTF